MQHGTSIGIVGRFLCVYLAIVTGIPFHALAQEQESVPDSVAAPQSAEIRVSEEVLHDTSGTFEIHVQGADLRGVLQLLSTQGRKNIVATQQVTGTVTANLYGVTFKEALEAVLRSTGYVYEEKGNFIYVYTKQQREEILAAERKMIIRVFHLSYLTAEDAQSLVQPALSSDGKIALTPAALTGIATSDVDAGGNSLGTEDVLVVRDYEDNVAEIEKILQKLDVRPEQILIEATILRASLMENNDLGIDFNALSGVNFQTLGSATDSIMDVTPNGNTLTGVKSAFTGSVPSGGLTMGIITNHISLFVRALESVTDVNVVANPKLLVINKQRGEVMIGNRDGYLTTTITETVATQTVQFLETGTRLIVRPYIGKEGFIRMEIHPEDSSGSVNTVGTAALPSETTTEVTSNVLVRDGHTIVIGGLFRERTSAGRSQVPIAGNIPYLGTMFRSTKDNTAREEVIILVTPHIVRQEQDEKTSEQIQDDVNRFRIGSRKGLRWWGRGPLAQTFMRNARQELSAGQVEKAMWNVDMALSLQPSMIEAIRLKEQLTQQAYWSGETRVSTSRYMLQRLIMQDLGLPVDEIILPSKPLRADQVKPQVREALGIGEEYFPPLPEAARKKLETQVKQGPVSVDLESMVPEEDSHSESPPGDTPEPTAP